MAKIKKEIVDNSRILEMNIEDVMHNSMIPYSECVILDRALPRVEDGLKPVQRRILYSMSELGVTPDKPYRKAARIVGDCMGKYHPHGDTSIYDAMVRMAQPFNMNMLLVDGHGNYGSVDGDSPAAMRYTEAKLAPLAMELLKDIDKDTVKWSLNFDDTLKEPDMLPGRFPNLLVNGSNGIAVGVATNIPPHNICETIDGVVSFIDNSRITLDEMMKIIKAPDFPTGGYIVAGEGLRKAYETGKGKITIRAKIDIERERSGKSTIVITELPYQVNKAALLLKIAELREKKKDLYGAISDVVDESDRTGMRAVIRVKKDGNVDKILANLLKSTSLQTSFSINMIAIANGKPQQLGLLDIIRHYVEYQRNIIYKRTQYDLAVAKARVHILEGLIIAIENIEEIIKIIKNSKSVTDAKQQLRERYALSEKQAQAILDMRLARLTKLEVESLRKEILELKALIAEYEEVLQSKRKQLAIVRKEILDIKRKYKTERRSKIVGDDGAYEDIPELNSDAIDAKDGVVMLTACGNVKLAPLRNYTSANKEAKFCSEHELVKKAFEASGNVAMYAFTNLGNTLKFSLKELPEEKWKSRGQSLQKLYIDSPRNEKIIALFTEKELKDKELIFFTRLGMVRRTPSSEVMIEKKYYQSMAIKNPEELVAVEIFDPAKRMLYVTKQGMSLKAMTDDIPLQSRKSIGVKGIMLSEGDSVALAAQTDDEGEVIVVTDTAYSKRVIIGLLEESKRYRKGVKIEPLGGRQGDAVVFASTVKMPYEIVAYLKNGENVSVNSEDVVIDERTNKGAQIVKTREKVAHVYAHTYELVKIK